MAFTKTRIWRGSPSEVDPSADEPPPEEPEAAACSPEQAQLFERTAARLAGGRVLPGFEGDQTSPLAVTRFLPIEQLFSAQPQAPREPVALTPVRSGRRLAVLLARLRARAVRYERLPARPRPLRRLFFVALLIAVAVGAASALPLAKRRLAAVHAASAPPAAPARTGKLAHAVETEAEPQRTHGAPEQARGISAKPQGLERSAVDALISGDLNRAAQLYGRLADGAPHEPVYREARRILLNQTPAP